MFFLNISISFGQCCGSGMFIPNPGSKNSKKKERDEKKFAVLPVWAYLQRIIELSTQAKTVPVH
jgi:hypothetical protein